MKTINTKLVWKNPERYRYEAKGIGSFNYVIWEAANAGMKHRLHITFGTNILGGYTGIIHDSFESVDGAKNTAQRMHEEIIKANEE